MSSKIEKSFMTRIRDVIGDEARYEFPAAPTSELPTMTREQKMEVQQFLGTDPDEDDDDDDDIEEWVPEPTRKKKGKPGPKPKTKAPKKQSYQTKANKQMEDMLLGTKLLLSKGKY
jgi:hypothetical protein